MSALTMTTRPPPRPPAMRYVGVVLLVVAGACSGDGNLVMAPGGSQATVDSIAVTPPIARLEQIGQTQPFVATGFDAAGDTVDVTVTWASSDLAVASVAPSGVATAQGPGQVDITASVGGVVGAAVLTVAPIFEP